ncbi:hypothetical protein J2W22_002566 [Sphingomonas kyeonggiensis]|uniref:hypothetical protein n=1 Tax=Sphingomonas kyeonggiensis TaxID=1268553 RepID=UPI0027804980|nr:hypothetical protein [Sphingomonas kyeonggiensis]MDQ0250502.1 hypothetical protein [Sphingomonas kyeonggiensis]
MGAVPALAQETPPAPPPASAPAQEQQDPATDQASGPEIVVLGKRLQDPVEISLSQADIATYAASDIEELVGKISQQTGGKAPALLVNGRRANMLDIAKLPPEAIDRMELLKPEAAAELGFAPDQRVMNIILLKRFRKTTLEPSARFATEGGRVEYGTSATITAIHDFDRLNISIDYARATALYESERGILQGRGYGLFDTVGNVTPAGGNAQLDPGLSALAGTPVTLAGAPATAPSGTTGLTDWLATANKPNAYPTGAYRTLMPASTKLALGTAYNMRLPDESTLSLAFNYLRDESDGANGLARASWLLPAGNPYSPFSDDVTLSRALDSAGALRSHSLRQTLTGGLTLQGPFGKWNWVISGKADTSWSETRNDRDVDTAGIRALLNAGDPGLNPFGPIALARFGARSVDRVTSNTANVGTDILVFGKLLTLPTGGAITVNARGSVTGHSIDSSSHIGGIVFGRDINNLESDLNLGLNIGLLSRARGIGKAIGDVSASLTLRRNALSGVGSAQEYLYGLNWAPLQSLSLRGQLGSARALPPIDQRGLPAIRVPNVPVYDFVRGETANITQISGGNPDLLPQKTDTISVEASWRPKSKANLNFAIGFRQTVIRDGIGTLPAIDADVEAAFPDRFERDAQGRLTALDLRPINFERQRQRGLSTRFFLAAPFGRKAPPPPPPADPMMGMLSMMTGAKRVATDPESATAMLTDPSRGRIVFGLSYDLKLEDRLRLRDGLPERDLLATGPIGGRTPSLHNLTAQLNVAKGIWSTALETRWQSGSRADGPNGLDFSSLATVDLKLSLSPTKDSGLGKRMPWLAGARATIAVTNVTNARTRVTNAQGVTPSGYEPPYLDPLGRAIKFSLRKLF